MKVFFFAVCLTLCSSTAFATGSVVKWTANGVPVCTASDHQDAPQIVGNGSGGAIIAWEDDRDDKQDIYAQRINAGGDVQWAANGLPVYATDTDWEVRFLRDIVSDGAGGAVITWDCARESLLETAVYTQRVSADGAVQWAAEGILVMDNAGFFGAVGSSVTASDGAGGAIIAWMDGRNDALDIYAQRVNAGGALEWIAGGIPVCTAAAGQQTPMAAVSDGAGGAVIIWEDFEDLWTYDIRAQRVDAAGVVLWTADGVAVCNDIGGGADVASDGAGGVIVAWSDYQFETAEGNIYAQRVNGNGSLLWASGGVAICTASGYQGGPEIASDGLGGALITWEDNRSGSEDIFAQRVDADGTVLWSPNGALVCTGTGEKKHLDVVSGGSGAAVIVWEEERELTKTRGSEDVQYIYAQRLNSGGTVQWNPEGVAVYTSAMDTKLRLKTASDGAGGAIITWRDERNGNEDIYAQRVNGSGVAGIIPAIDLLLLLTP